MEFAWQILWDAVLASHISDPTQNPAGPSQSDDRHDTIWSVDGSARLVLRAAMRVSDGPGKAVEHWRCGQSVWPHLYQIRRK